MIDAVLLDPLLYEDPDHLMAVCGRPVSMTPEHFQHLRNTNRSVAGMAALDTIDFNLVDDTGPLRATSAMVTANFFELFGVHPVVGRSFRASCQHRRRRATKTAGIADSAAS